MLGIPVIYKVTILQFFDKVAIETKQDQMFASLFWKSCWSNIGKMYSWSLSRGLVLKKKLEGNLKLNAKIYAKIDSMTPLKDVGNSCNL